MNTYVTQGSYSCLKICEFQKKHRICYIILSIEICLCVGFVSQNSFTYRVFPENGSPSYLCNVG